MRATVSHQGTEPVQSLPLLVAAAVLSTGGCDDGPAVHARPQTITFSAVAAPAVDQASLVVSATATSGLSVRYSSLTPTVCSVTSDSGLVTGLTAGTCTVAANQSGNASYAPAPQVTQEVAFALTRDTLVFAQIPALRVFDTGTLAAVDSAGANVAYTSLSPSVCTVDGATGLVTALAVGECRLVAASATLSIATTVDVAAASTPTVPGVPTAIAVVAGDTSDTAIVHVGGTVSGGVPIDGYRIVSSPAGITTLSETSPLLVHCPATCAGFAFSASASNRIGQGLPSTFVDMITDYQVTATFYEPDTQPNDTVFVGSFLYDATTGEVSNLRGALSEAMTGGSSPYPHDSMTWLPLANQLSAVPVTLDGAAGLLVTTFRLPSTDTLSTSPAFAGSDGFSPGMGMGRHFGYPGDNPGNAYARIFVNRANPTATPTQAQLDKLAYADCAPGGMMGATCMTGTTMAGYGSVGTMSGYPAAQTIRKR